MTHMTGNEIVPGEENSTQHAEDQDDLVTVLRTHGPLATKRVRYNHKTDEYKIVDYGQARLFSVTQHRVSNIRDMERLFKTLNRDPRAFVIRGQPIEGINWQCCLRRVQDQTNPRTGQFEPATFRHAAQHFVLLDIDGLPCPDHIDRIHDPDEVVEYVVSLLPPEFHGVTCWWAFTSGHGIKKGIRIRLGFYSTRRLSTKELKAWLGETIPFTNDPETKKPIKMWPVDTSTFDPVQPNYVATPVFENCHDPVPYRSGLWVGYDETFTPPDIDITSKRQQWAAASSWVPGSPGLGYEGWRALIGDQSGHGFYAPIKGAIATYFRRHGSDADPTWLRANLEDVIVERGHTRDPQYIESRIRGLDGLINHIRVLQAADEIRRLEAPFTVTRGQREFTVRAPSYTAPTSTIEEVCQSLTSALSPVILQYVPEAASQRRQWLAAAAIAEAEGRPIPPAPLPQQIGICADMAAGKTQAAYESVLATLANHSDLRVLYAIPNHKTAASTVFRINNFARKEVARVWEGMERPDPQHPGKSMCHRLCEMKQVLSAHGDSKLLCGTGKKGFCPYNAKGASEVVCGAQRQALAAADENIKIWLLPHALLSQSVPTALKKGQQTVTDTQGNPIKFQPDAFDVVILDEAPWGDMFGGLEVVYDLKLNDLNRSFSGDWSVPDHNGEEEGLASQRLSFLCGLAHQRLTTAGQGYVRRSAVREGENPLTPDLCREARRLTFRLLLDPANMINPSDLEGGVNPAIKYVAERNRVVMRMARMWNQLALAWDIPEGKKSAYLWIDRQQLILKWREDLSEKITALPIVYLDGTMNRTIAKHWLPRLEVFAELQAKTPTSVYRRQVGDSAISHRAIAPNKKHSSQKDLKTQTNNIARLARLLELRAAQFQGQGQANDEGRRFDGGVICPLATLRVLEGKESENARPLLPETFVAGNYNNVRGSNEFRAVRYGAVISRPQTPPSVPEELAWLTQGWVDEELELPPGTWYPTRPAAILMRDGTGREVAQEYHPHELAEAWRFQICEGEVVQGEARFRAKRRSDNSPLWIEIITNVVLPLEVDEIVNADDLFNEANPLALMVARGAVFQDADAIGQACSDVFQHATDKGAAVKSWFQRNPTVRDALRGWRESVTHSPEQVTNSLEGISLQGVRNLFALPRNGFAGYGYRRVGDRNTAIVHVRADIPNPLTHVESLLGPCDRWTDLAQLSNDAPLVPLPTPLTVMLERGAVFQDWNGIGQACETLFAAATDRAAAAKAWFHRHPAMRAELRAFAESGTTGFVCYRYRRVGDRKTAIVHVRAEIAHPRDHIEAIVGACNRWTSVPSSSSPPAVTSPPLSPLLPQAPQESLGQTDTEEQVLLDAEEDLEQFEPGAYEPDYEELLAALDESDLEETVEPRAYPLLGQLRTPWLHIPPSPSVGIDKSGISDNIHVILSRNSADRGVTNDDST